MVFGSYWGGHWQVYSMNTDGTDQVNLSNNSWSDQYPTWSPGGNKIAFSSTRNGKRDIYVMDPDGSNEAKLPTIFGDANFPAWSPDGTKIAFLAGLDIYVMNADGSNGQLLTTADSLTTDESGTNYIDEWPTWSPGNKIAFNSNRKDGSPGYVGGDYINTMNPDGSNIVQLPSGIEAHQPSWSPGGDMITFPSSPKVYKMNSDGSSVTELATGYDPSWSKDGNMIAFAQYVYTPGRIVFTVVVCVQRYS